MTMLKGSGFAQNQNLIEKPSFFKSELNKVTENRIINALDSLYREISDLNLSSTYLSAGHTKLTSAVLGRYLISPLKRKKSGPEDYFYQLTNIYGIGQNQFLTTVSIIHRESHELNYIIDLIATVTQTEVTFKSPLEYHCRFWKSKQVGNITYHFRDTINLKRAMFFDTKNTEIAGYMGQTPDTFNFYMCYNEQEVLKLLGIAFSSDRTGQTRNGFGVYLDVICSILNNEDFAHDVFHYYSEKINEPQNRNWIAEEGIAYLWGNAYYTDSNDEMITQSRLVNELKNYVLANPDVDLFRLFEKNTKIFSEIAPEISVQSTISGILAQETIDKKGMDGVNRLINAGSKERFKNYLKATDELIGVNERNFNSKVRELLFKN